MAETKTDIKNTISGPVIAKVDNVQSYGSPDCYARIIRYFIRDTRDREIVDGNSRPQVKIPNVDITNLDNNVIAYGANKKDAENLTKSLVFDIASDIMSCAITKTKSSPAASFKIVLSSADINYHHVLHPGDYIAIFMKRNRTNPMEKYSSTSTKHRKIFNNDKDSGLKLIGTITDVRKMFQTLPNGKKILRYQVSGEDLGGFFKTEIYYNLVTASQLTTEVGNLMFNHALVNSSSVTLEGLQTPAGFIRLPAAPDELVAGLVNLYLGSGMQNALFRGEDNRQIEIANRIIFLPREVDRLFYIKGREKISVPLPGDRLKRRVEHIVTGPVKFDKTIQRADFTLMDILRLRLGVEQYTKKPEDYSPDLDGLSGSKLAHVDIGNAQPLWSILGSYGNLAINEMFFDLKLHKDSDGIARLYPTLVLRQIPFTTSQTYNSLKKDNIKSTPFVSLPRIQVNENCIYAEDTGRGSSTRFNFLQIWGLGATANSTFLNAGAQVALGNCAIDIGSIKRYGLKSLISQTDFFIPVGDNIPKDALWLPIWTALMNDWWIGAHIYESGVFTLIGIEECISVGDNIEIIRKNSVNELYHIEGYNHSYEITANGQKSFTTSVMVTRGQRIDEYPIYAGHEIDPDKISDIGMTDVEFEGTARKDKPQKAISENEIPKKETFKGEK